MLLRFLLLVLTLLAPRALAEGLPDLGEAAQGSFSIHEERRIGEEIMRQVRADRQYYDDAEATDYVQALGEKLVAKSSDSRGSFQFFLMQDRSINAFALPGGFVGVHTGLILQAQSESEVASVMAHEIAHVTQRHIARIIGEQKNATVLSIAALVVAALAARSSPDAAGAAVALGQAGAIQNLINFTRDHEREADRIGLQILQASGFDPSAMAVFFQRLQRASSTVPSATGSPYLRTHPLTHERVADVQNRIERMPYKQVPDSLEFQLARTKLRVELEPPDESRAFYEQSLVERRFLSEASSRYGLALALMRLKQHARAAKEYDALKRAVASHPMVDTLGCRMREAAGERENALSCYRNAQRAWPRHRALTYDYAELLMQSGQPDAALSVVGSRLQNYTDDPKLYQLQAKAYAMQGKRLAQHRATGEAYARMGNFRAAVEQMQIAVKSGDGDFYQLSAAEARLRELRKLDEAQRRAERR